MNKFRFITLCGALALISGSVFAYSLQQNNKTHRQLYEREWKDSDILDVDLTDSEEHRIFYGKLADAALKQTESFVLYDPSYEKLPYPGGDVAQSRGVCADVVIRAYRALSIDLQVLVHEDMKRAFALYPRIWGLSKPDTSIDHRRVPNLMTYFRRKGSSLRVTNDPADYLPGDLVTWVVDGNRPHIGVVARAFNSEKTQRLIIHNIGWGVKREDRLFEWPITGHFRFSGN